MKVFVGLSFSLACVGIFTMILGCADQPNVDQPPKIRYENPLGRGFGEPINPDPLGIGSTPTPPATQSTPALIKGGDERVPALSKMPPLIKPIPPLASDDFFEDSLGPFPQDPYSPFEETSTFRTRSIPEGRFGLMNASGGVLTLWALALGNWVWGYTLADSQTFGDARLWRFLSFPKNFVMIKNLKTNSCLTAYQAGTVHVACDITLRTQMWELKPMSNQAIQIKNYASGQCLQMPTDNPFGDLHGVFSVYMADCKMSDNLDQQWYVIDIPDVAVPLYRFQ